MSDGASIEYSSWSFIWDLKVHKALYSAITDSVSRAPAIVFFHVPSLLYAFYHTYRTEGVAEEHKKEAALPPNHQKGDHWQLYHHQTEDPGLQNPIFKYFVCLNQRCGSERKCFDTLSARRVPLCGGDFQSKLDFCTQSRTRRCIEKFFLSLALLNLSVSVYNFAVF